MADYTVIADITSELLERLRNGLCPEVIYSRDAIGAVNDSTSVGYILSLILYGITKADKTAVNDMRLKSAAMCLEYMLVASSDGERGDKALEEQSILGGAAAIFNSKPYIIIREGGDLPAAIEMSNLGVYDRNSLSPHKPALFYRVSPVFIETVEGVREAARVIQVGGET